MFWRFTAFIEGLDEFSDQQTDALYEAGCSDGTLASGGGRAWIRFARVAPSLQSAISSAIAHIRATGLAVDHVEIDQDALAPAAVAQWGELTHA